MKRLLAVISWGMPLFAQYAGPAILSRGDAPTAMQGPQIHFRPFVEVSGIYNTGLAGVAVDAQGEIGSASSEGIQLGFGISGSHSWRHTELGLDYHGDINHYVSTTYYDSTDHSLLLGIKHQFTRHVSLNLRNSAGMFSLNNGLLGLPQTVPFDPSQSVIPTTDFFDNRTIYASSIADLTIQKTSRLSFDLGGGGFLNRRRSTALYGVTGGTAHADVQYRITRRSTIGANYTYSHYSFNHIFSSTDLHGASGSYATTLTQRLEFTGYAGFMRVETKFVQTVPVDPAIAAILGITQGLRVVYSIQTIPNVSGRLSYTFARGVAFVSGGHTVTPGNGLFLTSAMSNIMGGYTYTGLRRWSFNVGGGYNRADSIGNIVGTYGGFNSNVSVSRQIGRAVHVVSGVTVSRYSSPDFTKYNRTVYSAHVGLGFSPGDVPIRIW